MSRTTSAGETPVETWGGENGTRWARRSWNWSRSGASRMVEVAQRAQDLLELVLLIAQDHGVATLLELDRAALGEERSDLAQGVVGRLVLEGEDVHLDRLVRDVGVGLGRRRAQCGERQGKGRPEMEGAAVHHIPCTDLLPRHVHVGEDDQGEVVLGDLGGDVGVGDGLDRGQVLG